MAYWRRKSDRYVCVYTYDAETAITRALPRRQTKHLDARSDEEIEAWVRDWERLHEAHRHRPDTDPVPPHLAGPINEFLTHLKREKGLQPKTIEAHRRRLYRACLYFQNRPFREWPLTSKLYTDWLEDEEELGQNERRRHNLDLRKFWVWARDEDICEGPLKLIIEKVETGETPLAKVWQPQEILNLEIAKPDLKLLILIGYFFSLRPQETMALDLDRFVAGDEAQFKESSRALKAFNLYDRLSLYIDRVKGQEGQFAPPKKYAKGWVTCWSEEGAKEIVKVINDTNWQGFPKKPNAYYNAIMHLELNLTLKDMRRASLYHLAHYSGITVAALCNHARHRSIDTTRQYFRRPQEPLTQNRGKLAL